MSLAFPDVDNGGMMVKLDDHAYMVYSSRNQKDINLIIGVNMAEDIDDFTVINLGYESAMSTFTDRLDIIEFLKAIKNDRFEATLPTTQSDVDAILEKLSRSGIGSLTKEEMGKLKRF